jgi:hypothetical protein
MFRPIAATLLAAPLLAAPALAQSDAAGSGASAANQLGELEYCQAQGHVPASAVAAQRIVVAHMPKTPADLTAAQAEAIGKQGKVMLGNRVMTLDDMASSHGTTVAALCQQAAGPAQATAPLLSEKIPKAPKVPPATKPMLLPPSVVKAASPS